MSAGLLGRPTEITTAAYERDHGRRPRGEHGLWGFQRSLRDTAFEQELVGEIVWLSGSYAEARRQLAGLGGGLWAVLP